MQTHETARESKKAAKLTSGECMLWVMCAKMIRDSSLFSVGKPEDTISLVFVPWCLCGEIGMLGPHHKDTKQHDSFFEADGESRPKNENGRKIAIIDSYS